MELRDPEQKRKRKKKAVALKPNNLSSTDRKLFPNGRCRLILVGKTGAGKSSTGNTILGQGHFKPQAGINSETKECDISVTERNGLQILLVDTPGLCDTDGEDDILSKEITNSLLGVHPGPHAIILVLRCDARFTDQEVKVYNMLKDMFGPKMTDHLIVIFAGKDQLIQDGTKFEDQLEKAKLLKPLLTEADNRYVLFDNSGNNSEKDQQVEELLTLVRKVVTHNGGQCFRHKLAAELDSTLSIMIKEEIRTSVKLTETERTGENDKTKSPRRSMQEVRENPGRKSGNVRAGGPRTSSEDLREGQHWACEKDDAGGRSKSNRESKDQVGEEKAQVDSAVEKRAVPAKEKEPEETGNEQKRLSGAQAEAYTRMEEVKNVEKIAAVKDRRSYFENLLRPGRTQEPPEEPRETSSSPGFSPSPAEPDERGNLVSMPAQPGHEGNDMTPAQPDYEDMTPVQPGYEDKCMTLKQPSYYGRYITLSQRSDEDNYVVPVQPGREDCEGNYMAPVRPGLVGAGECTDWHKDTAPINDPDSPDRRTWDWSEGEEDIEQILNHLIGVLKVKDDTEREMSFAEKVCVVEDALKRKIVCHPEQLTPAQKLALGNSVRSVGQKIKEGMAKFALKTIEQCNLM